MSHATGTRVECTTVREDPGSWWCTVVVGAEGASSEHEVRLAWCDHDYWSGGLAAPGALVERLVRYLIDARSSADHPDACIPWPLPAKFDAAKARRWCPSVDSELKTVG